MCFDHNGQTKCHTEFDQKFIDAQGVQLNLNSKHRVETGRNINF